MKYEWKETYKSPYQLSLLQGQSSFINVLASQRKEQDTHLQPTASSFPVFLQPRQTRAGMLEQYSKWSALIYIRQYWCDSQMIHIHSCKLSAKVSQLWSQHSFVVSAWYFRKQHLKMPTEVFNMKLGMRQVIDHILKYKISFSFSYSSYAKPQTL